MPVCFVVFTVIVLKTLCRRARRRGELPDTCRKAPARSEVLPGINLKAECSSAARRYFPLIVMESMVFAKGMTVITSPTEMLSGRAGRAVSVGP